MKKGQKFYCCRCRRLLDASEFYYRDGNVRDCYCKECRKEYNQSYQSEMKEKKDKYEVITRVEDPERRLALARAAHVKVRELVQRIVRKRIETEGMRQLRYMKGGDHGSN